MRQTKTDRRSLRTRQLLMQAMLDLIRIRRYEAITVQEIADRANVGRSTFYAHFTDKDDLLVDGVQRMLAGLDAAGDRGRLFPSLALFHHVGAQADLYQAMARGRGLSIFVTAMQDQLTAMLTARLTSRVAAGVTPTVRPGLLAAMIASMLMTALRTWVESGLNEPAETVDRMFHTVAQAAVRAGLRPVDVARHLNGPR